MVPNQRGRRVFRARQPALSNGLALAASIRSAETAAGDAHKGVEIKGPGWRAESVRCRRKGMEK